MTVPRGELLVQQGGPCVVVVGGGMDWNEAYRSGASRTQWYHCFTAASNGTEINMAMYRHACGRPTFFVFP